MHVRRFAVVWRRDRAMARAYTAELRDRALRACAQAGLSRASVAVLFGVGRSTLYRWQEAWQRERRRQARPHAGGPAPRLDQAALDTLKDSRGRAQRPDAGRVRARARQACRGEGEPAYRVPRAQEAGPAAKKRACARPSRTGPTSPRHGTSGGPSWPRWIPSASSFSMRAASILGWSGPTLVLPPAGGPWARCRGATGSG